MQIDKEQIDDLNAVITVNIYRDDYQADYETALKEQRRKTNIKGFRPGKTPLSYVRKTFGKALMAEKVNAILEKSLVDFMKEEELEILGQPMASEDQQEIVFNTREPQNFEFKFDLGLAPKFEVAGVEQAKEFERMEVPVPKEDIEKELDGLRRRFGSQAAVEGAIEDNDILRVKAQELEDGEIVEGGVESEFSILVSRLHEEIKEDILKLSKGEHFDLDIARFEQNADVKYARKYLLKIDEDDEEVGNLFRGEILEISRIVPAQLDQEFFNKAFGEGKVADEQEALAFIRNDHQRYNLSRADQIVFKAIQDHLMDKNPMELPEAFLRRWLLSQNKEVDQKQFDKEFKSFLVNLKWTLIRSKLAKAYEIEVTQEELSQGVYRRASQMLQGYHDEQLFRRALEYISRDNDQMEAIHAEILSDKLYDILKGKFTIRDKETSAEDFEEEFQRVKLAYQEEEE